MKKHYIFIIFLSLLVSFISAKDLYWVGGTGQWSDTNHWAATSGGQGGESIPTENDNVFFDNNSFKTLYSFVTIANQASCNHFSWSNNKFNGIVGEETSRLSVKGNFTCSSFFQNKYKGVVVFNGYTPVSIENNYVPFRGDVAINSSSNVAIKGFFSIRDNHTLIWKSGNIQLKDGSIHVPYLNAQTNSLKKITTVNSRVYVSNGAEIAANTVEVNNLNSEILFNNKEYPTSFSLGGLDEQVLSSTNVPEKANTCGGTPFTITASIISNYNSYNVSCDQLCDGVTTVAISGGVGPFQIDWVGLGGTTDNDTVFNACQGNLGVSVTDLGQNVPFGVQCTDMLFLTNPIDLTINVSGVIDPDCKSSCDGAIGTNIGFGVPPYSISWQGSSETSSTITNICAGSYTINVVDNNGCRVDSSFVLSEPDSILFNIVKNDVNCNTACSGDATVAGLTGGNTGAITYTWNTNPVQTGVTANNLCAGTYSVTVEDSKGCQKVDSVVITAPNPFTINSTPQDVTCGGACDGQISVSVNSGGTAPFTHYWSNGVTVSGSSSSITNLCPGTYSDSIVDANNCDTVVVYTIIEPDPIVSNIASVDLTCYGVCDGEAFVVPTGGTAPYTYSWDISSTNDTIRNLCAGEYKVTISDNNNCSIADSIIVLEPDSIIAHPNIYNISCNGQCDGSIQLNPTGGTAPYTYLWAPNGETTDSISQLCAGTYTVTITDQRSCTQQEQVVLSTPTTINIVLTPSTVSCNGQCDGEVSAAVTGGVQPYSYAWSNGNTTDTLIQNLCAGSYSVTVTDITGCSSPANVTLADPATIVVATSGSPIGCTTNCDGSASAQVTGGIPPYTYAWDNGGTDSALTNLCIATYNVVVTDSAGCIASGSYIVSQPPPLSVTVDTTLIDCNNDCNGAITLNVTTGTAPITFNWLPGGETTNAINSLCPGNYIVAVVDSNGCTYNDTIPLINPAPLLANEVVTHANCGVCDGSIVTIPSGGTAPYSHLWDNGTTDSLLNNLCAGVFTDTITDNHGCKESFTVSINNPNGPTGVTSTINDVTCYSACDGDVNVIPIGGTPPYTYNWIPGNLTTPTINNLCAGTYTLTVTDAATCQLNTMLTIIEPDSLLVVESIVNPSCNLCNGSIQLNVSGGATPFNYLWSNGETTKDVSDLCPGNISVTITDANNCSKTFQFTLSDVPQMTATITQNSPLCNGLCNGDAQLTIAGGTAPYVYQWDDPASSTTAAVSNLCAGTYAISITDSNNCTLDTFFVLTEPTPMVNTPSITHTACGVCLGDGSISSSGGVGPYSYLWSNGNTTNTASTLCAGTFVVEVTDNNTCVDTVTIAISNTDGPDISVIPTDVSCQGSCDGEAQVNINSGTGPFTYSWQPTGGNGTSANNLCAGDYTVEVTDVSNCIAVLPFSINEGTPIIIDEVVFSPSCNDSCDGGISLNISGGVPPYTYAWGNGATSSAVSSICDGTYTVIVTDNIGCTASKSITLSEPNAVNLTTVITAVSCPGICDGEIATSVSGGTAPYTYIWSNGSSFANQNNLCADTYNLIVRDVNGCQNSEQSIVPPALSISVSATVNDAACGQCDGDAVLTPSGGTGAPYTIEWSSINITGNSVSNLCPGSYPVIVSDNRNCELSTQVLINNVNGPTINVDSDSLRCNALCEAKAWVDVVAGNAPYSYQWDDPVLQTADTARQLCSGVYSIVVKDNLNCISVDTISVSTPSPIQANFTSVDPNCVNSCNGSIIAIPTGGVPPYTYNWPHNGNNTNSVANLCANTYTLAITDNEGCVLSDSVLIADPLPVSIAFTTTDVTCRDNCDGGISASVSGGVPPYSYSWDIGSTSPIIHSLCPGTYRLTITDGNNCSHIDSVTIANPSVLTTTSVPSLPSCVGVCDGSILTTPSGGSGPYTYQWSNGGVLANNIGLCVGSYNVIVVDNNNCTAYDTIMVINPDTIRDSVVVTQPGCGLCDGELELNPVGGVGPYTFVWDNGATTGTIQNLCAGTYEVEITDQGTNCVYNFTYLLNSSNGPTVTLSKHNESCINACDGSAAVTASGGTAPYTYSWTGTTLTGDSVHSLCVGNYQLTVTDVNSCITTDTFSIATTGLDLNLSTVTHPSCSGDCNGVLEVTASGGSGPYSYLWSDSETTPSNTSLCDGGYQVVVTDQNGCSDSISSILAAPNAISINLSVTATIDCFSDCDGEVTASVSGGATPYTILWNNGVNSLVNGNLCAGEYIIVVTDNNGCSSTDTINLSEPSAIVGGQTLIPPTCGQCDGQINVMPTGGVAPYDFLWGNGVTTPGIVNLCAGVYEIDITDQNGCVQQDVYTLSNDSGPDVSITKTQIACFGDCNGDLIAVATGKSPFTYQWSPNNETTAQISNLCDGMYQVSVTDSMGCVTVVPDTLSEPDAISINLNKQDALCNNDCNGFISLNTAGGTLPYSYNWSNGETTDSISNLCSNTYTVTITDNNNCQFNYVDSIINPTALTNTFTTQDATCTSVCDGRVTTAVTGGVAPYNYSWEQVSSTTDELFNVCYNIYNLTVTDNNGCELEDSTAVHAIDTVLAIAGPDTSICALDPLTIVGTTVNANTVEWIDIDSNRVVSTNDSLIISSPVQGTRCYSFVAYGACDHADTVCVTFNDLPTIITGGDESMFEGESVVLSVSGGLSYQWSPGESLSDSLSSSPTATPEETTVYEILVTNQFGCVATDSLTVTIIPNINFSDGITPNGDGINDTWVIGAIEEYEGALVEIYNRWGEVLMQTTSYQNDWDGTYNGKPLPVGTYYFIIDLKRDDTKPYTGPITIMR